MLRDGGGEAGAQGALDGYGGLRATRDRPAHALDGRGEVNVRAAPPACCGTAEAKPEREARSTLRRDCKARVGNRRGEPHNWVASTSHNARFGSCLGTARAE